MGHLTQGVVMDDSLEEVAPELCSTSTEGSGLWKGSDHGKKPASATSRYYEQVT